MEDRSVAGQLAADIAQLRRFNRFYTVEAGLLGNALLASPFSLTEARVLYELAHRDGPTASDLKRDLGLDAGYLSRILKRFETRGLVERHSAADDLRKAHIRLTADGRNAYAQLDRDSSEDARGKLAGLSARDRSALMSALGTIEHVLAREQPAKPGYVLRAPRIGDYGWIAHRQGVLYAEEYGFDASFEALVSEILAEFAKTFDPQWERGWIAERNGVVVGSVFAMRKSKRVAKLRLLYVEPSARGLGIGRRLVAECVAFAKAKGYAKLTLWTQANLLAARRLYEEAGFTLVDSEEHRSFGKDLVGETWELDLKQAS